MGILLLFLHPFHLTFFNEIAGGPQRGYRYLADSNVDWGQGLKAVRNYLEANPQPNVRLSSFTFFIRPELYGVEAEPLPPLAQAPAVLPTRFNPTPGTYVISASTLRGLQLVDREMYNWFWHREPDDMIANALLVYHVSKREPKPSWLAQCTIPITPLSPQAVIEGFGRTDLRLLAFDCTQSWPYPGGGDSAGWYALHRDIATAEDIFVQQQLTAARLSFEKKTSGVIPSVTVFEWNPLEIPPPQREKTLRIGPAEWPPTQTIAEGTIVSVPVTLEGPLVFLGHDIITAENMVTLLTYWQVVEPVGRPFSLMGHLVGIDGQHVAVGDGLGIPWDQLQPGDVFIQRHSLPIPIEMSDTSFWLQTGAYWLDTMDRWRVDGEQEADALFLEMPSAESED